MPFINRNFVRLLNEGSRESQPRALELAQAHIKRVGGVNPHGHDFRHLLFLALHPLGIHEWVKVLVYYPAMDRIVDPGRDRYICRNCKPKGQA